MHQPALAFSFDSLRNGLLGISAVYGAFLAEAASHCLRCNNHANPTLLDVTGDLFMPADLRWCDQIDHSDLTWADSQEATEYGAYGVGIVVALRLTHASQVERSAKGTGVDYWLGSGQDPRGIFQRTARLEISGILSGDGARVGTRLREKLIQVERSMQTGMPAYVAIINFGTPEARFVKAVRGSNT